MKKRIPKRKLKQMAKVRKKRRPFFNLYDYIEFELNTQRTGPRWNLNVDEGPSGRWVKGIVTDADLNFIEVEVLMPNGIVKPFRFPNYASSDYDPEQWFFEGYLRKEKDEKDTPSCECGYGDESNLHFMFCPMHDWLKKEAEKNRSQVSRP